MGSYIICENTKEYGWCLFRVAGSDHEKAVQWLKEEQEANPDKQLRLQYVEEEDCWWNHGRLD